MWPRVQQRRKKRRYVNSSGAPRGLRIGLPSRGQGSRGRSMPGLIGPWDQSLQQPSSWRRCLHMYGAAVTGVLHQRAPTKRGLCCVRGPSVGPTSPVLPPTVTARCLLISSDLSIHPFSSIRSGGGGRPRLPSVQVLLGGGILRCSRARTEPLR